MTPGALEIAAGRAAELAAMRDEEVFDAAIDLIGGETLSRFIPAVRPDGAVLVVGNASGQKTQFDTADLVSRLTCTPYKPLGGLNCPA